MMWAFETEPEFQDKLDWADDFVRNEVASLDHVIKHGFDMTDPLRQRLIPSLQDEVRKQGLWHAIWVPSSADPVTGSSSSPC
jgi:acyl-CoA dehydrogenase